MSDPVSKKLGYHPLWLDSLAADVLAEGSVLKGTIQGAEAVKKLLGFARSLYEYQLFSFVGDIGDGYWMETYTSKVRGVPITNTAIIHRNEAGETDHIAMTHRDLNALHLFSALLRDEFGDTLGAGLFYEASPQELEGPDRQEQLA